MHYYCYENLKIHIYTKTKHAIFVFFLFFQTIAVKIISRMFYINAAYINKVNTHNRYSIQFNFSQIAVKEFKNLCTHKAVLLKVLQTFCFSNTSNF